MGYNILKNDRNLCNCWWEINSLLQKLDRKTSVFEVKFWFPTVEIILVIFKYVVADIILYSKSSSSAETVKFWLRTSSQRRTPGRIPLCGQCRACVSKNWDLSLESHFSAILLPNSIIYSPKKLPNSYN